MEEQQMIFHIRDYVEAAQSLSRGDGKHNPTAYNSTITGIIPYTPACTRLSYGQSGHP